MRLRTAFFFSSAIALASAAVACSGDDSQSAPGASPDASLGSSSGAASSSGGSSGGGSSSGTGPMDATASSSSGSSSGGAVDAGDAAAASQVLVTTVGVGVTAVPAMINQGTAIGGGQATGGTPVSLANVAADPANGETIVSASDPFSRTGDVPDNAAGFCVYPDAGPATRVSYNTGSSFETFDGGVGTDPEVAMAPYYFPLVYTSPVTATPHGAGSAPPMIGLFDWRPKDIDEAVVAAESDDYGKTWYFMQQVLELFPDYTNTNSGGYDAGSTNTGCPPALTKTNKKATSANGSTADDGWGHATVLQLPDTDAGGGGQFLYLLDRSEAALPGSDPDAGIEIVDNAQLHVIQLLEATEKFPIWNTNKTNNDIKSISSALAPQTATPQLAVQSTVGLLNPDGIMAVFPTAPSAAAGSEVTVLYVQKIIDGDMTGSTAMPAWQQCNAAPVSGDTNHDISNVRLATTTDGIHFTDQGIVTGLNDPTTVDYNGTRWIAPRGTLLDINGDGTVWGLYFSGGNCLDGDSDAFHYIGYAESTDKVHWTVFNDINHPIAIINKVTATNQATGTQVTIPANPPVFPTEYWFAERLYAPTAVQIDSTHLAMTFAGYGVQSPSTDLLDYRQIGNVVLTVSKALPAGVPNNINAH